MGNCVDCGKFENSGQTYIYQAQEPFCEQCGGDNLCFEKLDAKCVVYHLEGNQPTHLQNLGMPNGSTAEQIFEAIDDLIGNGSNLPIVPQLSDSVLLSVSGSVSHELKADVIVSPDSGNGLVVRSNGLFSSSIDGGKVKVDEDDALDYLEEQIIGGTDGIVSNSVVKSGGQLQVQPSIDIEQLLIVISQNPIYINLLCQIVANCVCNAPTNVSAEVVND